VTAGEAAAGIAGLPDWHPANSKEIMSIAQSVGDIAGQAVFACIVGVHRNANCHNFRRLRMDLHVFMEGYNQRKFCVKSALTCGKTSAGKGDSLQNRGLAQLLFYSKP
jgi:hypothetical protein